MKIEKQTQKNYQNFAHVKQAFLPLFEPTILHITQVPNIGRHKSYNHEKTKNPYRNH